MAKLPRALEALQQELKQLPGVGRKTAERYAFHLLTKEKGALERLGEQIAQLKTRVKSCETCGALTETTCPFCTDPTRQKDQLCIVSSPRDIFVMEETRHYRGHYHVLGTLISPLEGKMPDQIDLAKLERRLEGVTEVIIALDSTLEGDATALYLKEELARDGLVISRLALGIPVGSSFDFIDEGTLARALVGRQQF